MVSMSNVWDRAMDVVRGRTGVLASIAASTLFLPALVRDAVTLLLTPGSTGFALAGGLLAIVAALIALWGQLALLAVATDPATTHADATRQATARFPVALAVTIVAILVVMMLLVPVGVVVGLSGADFTAMGTRGTLPDIGGGTAAFLALYALALLIAGLLIGVRLVLTNAVVLNERRGLGAFRRSWELTRGLTWRLVGVVLLYLVVIGVAVSAAQFITGAVFGLLLDSSATVAFLAAAAAGVVTTIFSVIAAAFTAQLYVAVTQRGVAAVFA
ncbi:glycerophosphoryl diester phosphodiesterase membrane domain-containing protein [Sphingomonas sp.]|uniref:glycerophosphoryl diester phosphodiesterase membrane domain-containing protein n=1 Tax=Sphingomonas sp. TaxID=28214 RepID=UPI0035BBEC96